MYDGGKIVTGLVIFVGLATFPVWYTAAGGRAGPQPTLTLGTTEKACVAPKEVIRATHMEMLNDWRMAVVRDGEHYATSDGKPVHMSLTGTCLGCHTNKAQFCDKCHDYAAVSLTCFNCHVDPKGSK